MPNTFHPKISLLVTDNESPHITDVPMCQVEVVSRVMDELSLDHSDQGDFDVNNPKTWSKESVAHIETTLDVNEVTSDRVYLISISRNI